VGLKSWRWSVLLLAALVTHGCASSELAVRSAFLEDARRCEADADGMLHGTGRQHDPGVRMMFLQTCLALLGWSLQSPD